MHDSKTHIFYEPQSNGLCRMHSINAFFGHVKITSHTFKQLIKEYDQYLLDRFNVHTSSGDFDLVNSDQTTLVGYILKKHGVHTRYYSLNAFYEKPLSGIHDSNFIFVYNESHIWGVRRLEGIHYRVDSITGVTRYNIQNLSREKNIGLLVPVDMQREWNRQMDCINTIMDNKKIKCRADLAHYLRNLVKRSEFLGDFEIPVGVAVSILETKMSLKPHDSFAKIQKIIDSYTNFMASVTKGKYGDQELILAYIPDVIFELSQLTGGARKNHNQDRGRAGRGL